MVNKELADYVKRQFEHGHDSATIREHLLKHGYTETIADEALHDVHPPEKPHIKGLKYLPFSGKKMAIAFLILFALGGIGFALMNLLGSGDLAGAATEPTDMLLPHQIKQETIQEEPEEEQPTEEISEEPVEETTEEIVEEKPATKKKERN